MNRYVRMRYPCRIGNKLIDKDEKVRLATIEEIEKHYPGYLREASKHTSTQILVKFDHLDVFTFISTSQIYLDVTNESY